MKTVTERQKEALEVIRDFEHANGYTPSIRDIGEKMSITSPNGVVAHLDSLAKKGLISRHGHLSRTIRLTTKGRRLLGMKVRDRSVVEDYKRNREGQCEFCRILFGQVHAADEVHHIASGAGRSDEECNLLCVCSWAHKIIHKSIARTLPITVFVKHEADLLRIAKLRGVDAGFIMRFGSLGAARTELEDAVKFSKTKGATGRERRE